MKEQKAFLKKFQVYRANWEDLEDMIKFNQILKMIKSKFLKLESKSDLIQIWILHMFQYLDYNFYFKYLIKVILVALES